MEGWGRDLGTRRCGPRRRRPPSPSVLSSPRQGAAEYEPRVVNQLLDFLYRYVSETLADADVREWERQSEGGAGRRGAHTSTPPLPSSLPLFLFCSVSNSLSAKVFLVLGNTADKLSVSLSHSLTLTLSLSHTHTTSLHVCVCVSLSLTD